MKRIFLMLAVAMGLGACSHAVDVTSAIGAQEASQLNASITPTKERNSMIEMLERLKVSHLRDTVRDIETR